MMFLLDIISFIDSVKRLRDLPKVILETDIFDELISSFMLMDGLDLLLNGVKQVDHPAVHSIALPLFLILLSQLLHIYGKTVLF